MNFLELVRKNRSYRRFYQERPVPVSDLELMVEAARLTPSSRNIQPLKYIICNDREVNAKIFETLAWAGYLTDWDGPAEGERPAAYIVQLLDMAISSTPSCDHGIAVQTLLLESVELGYGGCIIASVKHELLSKILSIEPQYKILHVVALGVPKEQVVIESVVDGQYKYWRDQDQTHHVPKRSLDEIILKNIS